MPTYSPFASSSDVAELLARELSDEETLLADRRLLQVERMILRRVPDLVAQVAAGDINEQDVIDIEAEAVYRVMRNPDGLFSETDGQYGYQRTREAADNSLRITADEWATLGVRVGKMFSITPNLVAPVGQSSFWTGG